MSNLTIEQMLNNRIHIGHLSSKWNPQFAPYILTKKNERHIIDLRKTQQYLEDAIKALQEIVRNGGKVLFVGTKKQAQSAMIEAAIALEGAYITERWLGGTLTNFPTINKSIKKMTKMDDMENDVSYKNLTKKEQSIEQTKKEKLTRNLIGIKNLKRLPQALFVVDIKKEITAVREAKKLNIPVFALVDTNNNPGLVDYPIPANDDAKASISLLLDYIVAQLKPTLQAWKEARENLAQAPQSTSQPPIKEEKKIKKSPPKVEKKSDPKPTKAPEKKVTMDKKEKLQALRTLRERTKASVTACHTALMQAEGDIDKAIDTLYIEAQKKAAKLSEKATPNSFVFGKVNKAQNVGVLMQLSCQTDFVGNNEDFVRLANEIVDLALKEKLAKTSDLLKAKIETKSAQELINFWIAAFGENIIISDYVLVEGERLTIFLHPNKKVATLLHTNDITLKTTGDKDLRKQLAMQITLNKPMGITEKEVIETLQAGGKKIPNVEKIAQGKALMTQPFMDKESQTVEGYLKEVAPELSIKGFVKFPQPKKN